MNVNINLMEQYVIQISVGTIINVNVSVKKHHVCEKDYVWNHSAIICDEIIYTEETNFNKKYIICETQNFYTLLAFLLITIALLIAVSVYCYLIKYGAKHLLPFRNTKLKTSPH